MTETPFRLDGRVAIVTGGGTGIGRATAVSFAAAGAHVVVAARSLARLRNVTNEIGGTAIVCDTTDLASVERLFESAQAVTGKVDVLVNNAGQTGPVGNLVEVDLAMWRECVEVNLFGAIHCMRAAARIMCAQHGGSIINMSSLMGLKGHPMRTAYAATKFALIGITESLAREVGPFGVRVNALCPGAVKGELMDGLLARRAAAEGRRPEDIANDSYTNVAALRRWVEPSDVAAAALFLACDASRSVTGDRIKIDAGRF